MRRNRLRRLDLRRSVRRRCGDYRRWRYHLWRGLSAEPLTLLFLLLRHSGIGDEGRGDALVPSPILLAPLRDIGQRRRGNTVIRRLPLKLALPAHDLGAVILR